MKDNFTEAQLACAAAYVAVRSQTEITRLDANGKAHPAAALSIDDAANLLSIGTVRTHGPHRRHQ